MDVEIHLLIGSLLIFALSIILAIVRHADILAEILPEILSSFKFKHKSLKKERRIYPRYKASLKMKYRTPAEENLSWASDIGRGGLRFFLTGKVPEIGNLIRLEINLPDSPKPISAEGNIAWVRRNEAGLSFNKVEQDDITRIIQYTGNEEQVILVKKHQFV